MHFHKMHFSQNALSAKCTFLKMYFSQNAPFAKCSFRKMHFSQNALFAKCTFLKMHLSQNALFAKCTFCKMHFSQNVHFSKLTFPKMLPQKFKSLKPSLGPQNCLSCTIHSTKTKDRSRWKGIVKEKIMSHLRNRYPQ